MLSLFSLFIGNYAQISATLTDKLLYFEEIGINKTFLTTIT